MNHQKLFGQDLAGWQLVTAYLLQLKHGLMGFFPAVFGDNNEPFVCLDPELVLEIGRLLPARRCEVVTIRVLANPALGIAFDLSVVARTGRPDADDTHIVVLTRERFAELTADPAARPFEWAPGLIGGQMSHKEFVADLQQALKTA